MVKFEYRHEDSAGALARNWWRVLLVDGLVAVVVLALGVLSIVKWNEIVGWVLVLLAVAYAMALIGRARAWKARRVEAGIDD
jgi:Ca2+/Na+ antiporter